MEALMSSSQDELLENAIEAVKKKQPKNIFFVACGSSMAYMCNQQYIFDLETEIPAFVLNSNEFLHRRPKALGNHSLVVTCSHSGSTPETVEATQFAREKGALTVAYSNKEDSPLWREAECNLYYDWGPEADAFRARSGMALRFVFGALHALQPQVKYAKATETAKNLSRIFECNKGKFAPQAESFGSEYKREPVIYTMGSGPLYAEAYAFAICVLQKMLWVNSAAIHSGEYFHGTFEITDYDVPFMLFKNAGETRPLDDRAEIFAKKFSKRVIVIDANTFDWNGIDEELYRYFSAPIMGAVAGTYAERLSEHKGHPLTVRRYMGKMEY